MGKSNYLLGSEVKERLLSTRVIAGTVALLFGMSFVTSMAVSAATTTVTGTNFNTHVGDDYKGVNVGFNVTSDVPLKSVEVSLLADGEVIATNTGTKELFDLHTVGETTELSTPFITYYGDMEDDPYWLFGDWTTVTAPDQAQVIVNGEETILDLTLSEPNEWTFDTLLPQVTGDNFNTHAGSDYEGVNVGFWAEGFESLDSVSVLLLDGEGNVIVENTGTEDLSALYADGVRQFSTPFITTDLAYGEDNYWIFGEWTSYKTPVTAVVTVNGEIVEINPLTEADGILFADLVAETEQPPQFATSKDACKNGGWELFAADYKNQGQCVASVVSNGASKTKQ